jgi:starch phosphorylase
MRLLVDEMNLDWERAWSITRQTFGYTNHTLLPGGAGALAVTMFGRLLPRLLEIIYEINAASSTRCAWPSSATRKRIRRLSLIDEAGESTCAWRTSPASAATRSTAWRRCIPDLLKS